MSSQITPLFPVSGTDTAKVQGIPVSTVDPINGQVLVYNSATSQYEPAVATTGANEITLGTAPSGTVAEVSTFTFLGDPATWDQLYFTIGVPTGQAYVWFNRDGNHSDPAPAGFVRGIQIEPGDAFYGSAAENRTIYANTMVATFGNDPDLSATRSGDVVTITSRASGARTNITLGNLTGSDASVAVVTEGAGTAGTLGSVVLKSGNANADVSIKNIDGNIRFEKSSGNVVLGNSAGTVALTSDLPTLGTGVATALAINVGTAGAFVVNGGALGTPSSGTVTNLTGTASININGTVGATTAATGAFTTITSSSATDATTNTTTGAVVLSGGLAVAKSVSIGPSTGVQLRFIGGNSGTQFETWTAQTGTGLALKVFHGFQVTRATNQNSTLLDVFDNTTSNATTPYLRVRNSNGDFFQVGALGNISLTKTITATGTTGAQTINKTSGSVNFAAAASSLVVTNSFCTVNSVILLTVGTNDTTMRSAIAVAAAGSFTIYPTNAPTAETRVYFTITN
jgi:hypothetical protein